MRIAVEQSETSGSEMVHPLAEAQVLAPEIVGAGMAFSSVTYERTILPLRVFEAARARTAEINGCQICQNFRADRDLPRLYGDDVKTVASNGPAPDGEFYASVSQWRTSPLFDDRERIAIEYAEGLGLDPHGIAVDEDFWRRAKAVLSDAELVDLSFCIACWMGQGRVLHALGLDSVCSLGPVALETANA
jgi:alkylhydroperoxidase family enzyme